MNWNFVFFLNSFFLGIGLAMDAFSVSLVNGLNDPCMKKSRAFLIAIVFAIFQALMPITGWIFVSILIDIFKVLEKTVPYISLFLLVFIGGKMIYDGVREKHNETTEGKGQKLSIKILLLQGIATSLDALSVGFTLAEYTFPMVLVSVGIIALITFILCAAGVYIGKKVGTKISGKASILGGVVLILIGVEIFLKAIL